MHIQALKKELVENLGKLIGITNSKIDALSNFVISASPEKTYLYASDTETAMKVFLQCDVIEEGNLCVNAKKFYEIVKELSENIEIRTKDKWVYIQSGQTAVKLATFPIEEYPTWQESEYMYSVDISCAELESLIDKTLFAVGEFDTRYVLNGILFHVLPEKIRFVGTDGHRLSIVTLPKEHNISDELKLLIPKKSIMLLKKNIKDCESIQIFLSEKFVKIQTDEFEMLIRLYEGSYPDYTVVIPSSMNKTVVLNKDAFISAIKRVSVVSSGIDAIKTVIMTLNNNDLELQCKVQDIGEAKDSLTVQYENEPFTIGFNAKYLIESLSCVDSEEVSLQMSEQDRPIYFKDTNGKNISYEHIVMPIRM